MGRVKAESDGSVESGGGSDEPDFKWAVEYLVREQGQRRAAALLGVNRKTVAMALRRERLTARMNHAVQTLLARDDPGGQPAIPLERMQSQIQSLLESMKELDRLVGKLTSRVRALEEAQAGTRAEAETDEEGLVDATDGEGQQDEPAGEPAAEPEREQDGRGLGWWRR